MEPTLLGSTITTTSGLELFNSIRYETSLPVTFIHALDHLSHTAATEPLHRGDVIELQGVTGSGKTQLLYKFAINSLLPKRLHVRLEREVAEIEVGGKEEFVCWMDCTSSRRGFDVNRLSTLLETYLVQSINHYRRPKGLGAPTTQEVDSLIDECLTRLHVFSLTSTIQLASTLQTLPDWFKSGKGGDGSEDLGMVIIDGMTEFAWSDQYDAQQLSKTASSTSSSSSSPRILDSLKHFSKAIANLRLQISPLILISQWVLVPSRPHSIPSQAKHPFYKPHFTPPSYPLITDPSPPPSALNPSNPLLPHSKPPVFSIDFHLTLHPAPKPVFRKGITVGMILKEGRKGFVGGNRRTGEKRLTEGIVVVVREKGGQEVGSFELSISEDDVIA
ncbi:hypothetical protein JCM5353_002053 [Sporobolomyces roseus]